MQFEARANSAKLEKKKVTGLSRGQNNVYKERAWQQQSTGKNRGGYYVKEDEDAKRALKMKKVVALWDSGEGNLAQEVPNEDKESAKALNKPRYRYASRDQKSQNKKEGEVIFVCFVH